MNRPKLEDLERFFAENPTNLMSVRVSVCEIAIDLKKSIEADLDLLRGNRGNRRFLPAYLRLVEVMRMMEEMKKNNQPLLM